MTTVIASSTGARLAQSVEHETFNLRVVGSSPTLGNLLTFGCFRKPAVRHTTTMTTISASPTDARLAQLVEHETPNLRVMGSSPTLGDFVFVCVCLCFMQFVYLCSVCIVCFHFMYQYVGQDIDRKKFFFKYFSEH